MSKMEYEQMKHELLQLKNMVMKYTQVIIENMTGFFVVTPKQNLLYIKKGYLFGFNVYLEYIPSIKYGSCCTCNDNDEDVRNIDLQTIQKTRKKRVRLCA